MTDLLSLTYSKNIHQEMKYVFMIFFLSEKNKFLWIWILTLFF